MNGNEPDCIFLYIQKRLNKGQGFQSIAYHYQLCKLGHSYFGYGLGILSSTYIFVVYIAPLVPCTDRWDVCTYLPSNDSWKISITNMNVRLWFSHFKIVDICHFRYKDSHMKISIFIWNYLYFSGSTFHFQFVLNYYFYNP